MIFLRDAAVFAELGASTPFIAVFIMIFCDVASVDGGTSESSPKMCCIKGYQSCRFGNDVLGTSPLQFLGLNIQALFHNEAQRSPPGVHPVIPVTHEAHAPASAIAPVPCHIVQVT